jgi:outer membrane protein TolC
MTSLIEIRRTTAAAIMFVFLICAASAAAQQTATTQPVIFNVAQCLVPVAGSSGAVSNSSVTWNARTAMPEHVVPDSGPRRITLDQAQQEAAAAANPLLRLGALGLEAAKQHRLGVQSDFFPKVSSTFMNVHFNKFLGEFITVPRPLLGTTTTFALPIFNKDGTLVTTNAMQPITPLFKLHQVLTIARADENIAKAKAGMPLTETAANVEQAYFALLVAQRQRDAAEAWVKKIENKWRLASVSASAAELGQGETQYIEVSKELVIAESKVKEATTNLNALLGWPLDTELYLMIPTPFYEDVSRTEATEQAMQNNPEVVEAQQTLVKARAASMLSKLEYVPDVAVTGGYAYQRIMPALPGDFSYVGVMGNYTLFDFGKRERTVKERNAQVAMAETGLALVKAKVAAGVTKAYFDLDRSRQLSELTRRMNAANRMVEANYDPDDARAARAKSESEMLQAEMEHRLAYSRLQQLIGSSMSGGK